jgi:hypothetical protein
MKHRDVVDQARCDIIRLCDEEVLGIQMKLQDSVRECSFCGLPVCRICNNHIDGPCPIELIMLIMEL